MNVFAQPQNLWEVKIVIKSEEDLMHISSLVEDIADNYSVFVDEDKMQWEFIGYFRDKDDIELLQNALNSFDKNKFSLQISEVQDKDWVLEVQKSFKPIDAQHFFIHSSYYRDLADKSDKITIEINPGRAFGTGEHETTKLCLQAISGSIKSYQSILDLGCGSGILAIAAKKIINDANVVGSDIDEVAINVARENAIKNSADIEFLVSDGFRNRTMNKKFDLIIANILANPLIQMASEIVAHLNHNGSVILSGFIENDCKKIIQTYENLGLKYIKTLNQNNWCCIIFKS